MVNPSQVREPAVQPPRCEITAFPCSHVCPKASFPRAWGGGQAPLPVGEQRSLLDAPPQVWSPPCVRLQGGLSCCSARMLYRAVYLTSRVLPTSATGRSPGSSHLCLLSPILAVSVHRPSLSVFGISRGLRHLG